MNNNEIEDLQNNLIQLYLKNLKFLKNEFTSVYNLVNDLSIKIENEQIKEQYTLEFKEEGYFDIFNKNNNTFLYNHNSYIEAEERANITDFSTNSSINLLRMDQNTNQLSLFHENLHLARYLNNTINFKDLTFSKIYKFIFIGTGGGVHLHEIYKKINSFNTLIIEPNLEIFRLSLFLIDYSIFNKGNKTLQFCISEEKNKINESLISFSLNHQYMNYNIKYHLFSTKHKKILNNIIDFYADNNPFAFSYTNILKVFQRTLMIMKERQLFINRNLISYNNTYTKEKILIISAGPSLDIHLEWIKKNQSKFIIICVDVIVKKLEKNKIKPDLVVSIDPSFTCAKYLDTEDESFLKESSIIFLSQQHRDTIEIGKKLNSFYLQVLDINKELGIAFSLPNVGTFSLAIAVILGFKELYLLGCDAAFNQLTGSRYAKDSSHTQIDAINKTNVKDTISRDDIIIVKGNLRKEIKSNRELLEFRNTYEHFLYTHKHLDFKAYNLSDGAYIEGLTPIEVDTIPTDKFENKKVNLFKILSSISQKSDNICFDKDKIVLTSIINRVKKFKSIKFKTKKSFLQEKIDLIIWILEKKKKIEAEPLVNIQLKFLETIDSYINFALNIEQKITEEKDFINSIKNYWCDSIINLLKEMKETIKS